MKKKNNADKKSDANDTSQQPKTTEQQPKPRHPDADYVQKTHFGYVGAYA